MYQYFVELILKVIKYFFKFHLLPKIFALTCIIKLYKEQDVQTATNYQNIADIQYTKHLRIKGMHSK